MVIMSKYINRSLLENKVLEVNRFAKFDRSKVWYIEINNIRESAHS